MEIKKKKKEVIKIFNKFYTYTSKNENITLNTTEKIREKFRKNKTLEFIGSTKIYLNYCKIILKEIDGQIEKKRYTKIIRELGSEDEEKFEQAITANIIQAYDAYLVREILKWKNIITIHDCFLIDWQNTSELINRINIEMNKKFSNEEVMNEDIFSIFIVL